MIHIKGLTLMTLSTCMAMSVQAAEYSPDTIQDIRASSFPPVIIPWEFASPTGLQSLCLSLFDDSYGSCSGGCRLPENFQGKNALLSVHSLCILSLS